ncbi:Homoserine dehydrogenase, partial [Perkinsus chesapeaki]
SPHSPNNTGWRVDKFGGTSMGGSKPIKEVAGIILDIVSHPTGGRIAVVVSAMSGVTNILYDLCNLAQRNENWTSSLKELRRRHFDCLAELDIPEFASIFRADFESDLEKISCCLESLRVVGVCPQSFYDVTMGYGEKWSATILCGALENIGVKASVVDGRRIIFLEEESDRVDFERSGAEMAAVERETEEYDVIIITGFVASDSNGAPTTLKRNGSDLSASIIARLLADTSPRGCDKLTIWTDVDGVSVEKAEMLESLSYTEAAEMAWFGAKVIDGGEGISLVNVEGCGLIGVTGIASRLFGAVGAAKVNVIMITQASSEHSICFAIQSCDRERCRVAIEQAFYREMCLYHDFGISITTGMAILAMVGDGMVRSIGILGRAATGLAASGVNICAIAQGSSERNITLVVAEEDADAGVAALHECGCCGRARFQSGMDLDGR